MENTLKISKGTADKKNAYLSIAFEGEFDKAGYSDIREQLDKSLDSFASAENASLKTLVFDFSKLKYINSQGIGVLMEIHTKLKELGKALVIVGLNANVKDVFNAIGMNEMVKLYDNMKAFLNK